MLNIFSLLNDKRVRDWLYQIGMPGKSGVSGGIVTVSPGKGGLGTFAIQIALSAT